MNRTAACLFGGTLFTAGLATHHAHAQEFTFEVNSGGANPSTVAYAYGTDLAGIGSFDSDLDLNFTPSNAYAGANYNGFGGDASVTPALLSAHAFCGSYFGYGEALAEAYAYFSVSTTADLQITWNFTGEQSPFPFTSSGISLRNWSDGGSFEFSVLSGDASSGSVLVPLDPGSLYALDLYAVSFEFGSGSTTATASLVGPACFADCDDNTLFNVDDVNCFASAFLGANLADADCDGNAVLNVDDVTCFADAFLTQCE